MSQYISVCISEGVPKAAIISEGFNYERWRKTAAKNKQVQQLESTTLPSLIFLSKLYIMLILGWNSLVPRPSISQLLMLHLLLFVCKIKSWMIGRG